MRKGLKKCKDILKKHKDNISYNINVYSWVYIVWNFIYIFTYSRLFEKKKGKKTLEHNSCIKQYLLFTYYLILLII